MKCPHCQQALAEHLTGASKIGRLHCYGCGCCFEPDGITLAPGVTACDVPVEPVKLSATVTPIPIEETRGVNSETYVMPGNIEQDTAPRRTRVSRRGR